MRRSQPTCSYRASGEFECTTVPVESANIRGREGFFAGGSSVIFDANAAGSSGYPSMAPSQPDCSESGCPVGMPCQTSSDCLNGLYCTDQVCSDSPYSNSLQTGQGGWWPNTGPTDGSQYNLTNTDMISNSGILGNGDRWLSEQAFDVSGSGSSSDVYNMNGAGGNGAGWVNYALADETEKGQKTRHHHHHRHRHHHGSSAT